MAQRISYSTFRGSSASHHATLRLPPDRAPCPVVVNVHGGFWKTQWSLQNLRTTTLLEAFAGCATWDVEYARVDQEEPASSDEGGGFPHTCLDVLAALNALADGTVPDELRSRLDLSRVYLCGHSAGGHIVLWIAMLSRFTPAQRDELAARVSTVAGEPVTVALRAGVSGGLCVRGVIGLAAVTCLHDALDGGLSDFHDAAINFLWRAGPSAAPAALCVEAACPYMLSAALPATAGLRFLLLSGLDDVDVPPMLSVKLAARLWQLRAQLWLMLVPGADHYEVAGLADTLTAPAAERWIAISSALRAFVLEHDERLTSPLSCVSVEDADALCLRAPPHTCARRTLDALDGSAEPLDAAMMRGLGRWFAWTEAAPPPQLVAQLASFEKSPT